MKISGKLLPILMLTFEKLLLQAVILTGIETTCSDASKSAIVTRNWICNRFERQNFHCFMTHCIQLLTLFLVDNQRSKSRMYHRVGSIFSPLSA